MKKLVKYPSEVNKLEVEDQIITAAKLGYKSHLEILICILISSIHQFTITPARWVGMFVSCLKLPAQ